MNVSECRVKLWDREPVCAIVSITLDDQFVVKGIRILNVQNRYIVCMPSRPGNDGRHRDVAHPINSETRERINRHVLDAYNAEVERCRHTAGVPLAVDAGEGYDIEETAESRSWVR